MNHSGLAARSGVCRFERTPPFRVVEPGMDEWPDRLSEIGPHRPPERLFVSGRTLDADALHVAIVGPRRPSVAGVEVTKEIARGLVEADCVVVSGLAVGIDGAAHRAALDAGGTTVAVVGCGLDVNYPRRNERLRSMIDHNGTVVSEHDLGIPPLAHHFPARNRIVAGLATAIVVIEGTMKSGALITARLALDANRAVFAVPGSWRNPLAEGPNELIRTCQAGLTTRVDHIFEELAPNLVWRDVVDPVRPRPPSLEPVEIEVLLALDDVSVTPDHVVTILGRQAGEVALAIARLEVRGLVSQRFGGYEISSAGARARAALIASGVAPEHS